MKKHNYQDAFILILCFSLSKQLFAQQPLNQINITAFAVKNKLPAAVSSWNNFTASIMLVAQKIPQAQIQSVKLIVLIKQNGTKICGLSSISANIIDVFNVRNFSSAELAGMLAQCPLLLPGNYSLCVQFFNIDNYPISREVCKSFLLEDVVQEYTPPQNVAPFNGKTFKKNVLNGPITFRWVPLIPKPKEKVIYRLRVWQLMQGQTASQAMKSNDTVADKEVSNVTQIVIANIITGQSTNPYLCEFLWNVQALDKDGNPFGKNIGMSELFSFTVK